MTVKDNIVFISLAQNQSQFFERVGKNMVQAGFGVVHVCFHEGAVKDLRASGSEVFNPYDYQVSSTDHVNFDDYDITNPSLLLGHEKSAYNLSDTNALQLKFKRHLAAMDAILRSLLKRGGNWCLVQELGGFTSVLAAYYAGRRLGIKNWFLEPSFFRGRMFFTSNTLDAPRIPDAVGEVSEEVKSIIESIVRNSIVVIPAKDRMHYRGPFNKLFDPKNVRRLFQKLAAKHLRGEQEEFQHIRLHVARHVRMLVNSLILSHRYQLLPAGQRFIYYPLHVPGDFALTIRSPEYLDQYALIDYLCRVAPLGYRVVIKEHPALVGAVSPSRIKDLCARHDNFALLPPSLNNHEVLAAADAVITVNSKSGAEALLHGTPVVVLGNAFYEDCPLVHRVNGLADLQDALNRALDKTATFNVSSILPFFQQVWDASFPAELYDLTPNNISNFSHSLARLFRKNST